MKWQHGLFTNGITSTVSGKKALEFELSPEDEKTAKFLVKRARQSRAKKSDVSVAAPGELQYLPYQIAGIEYMTKVKRCLLADDQGLGKTIQICGLINNTGVKNVLIICPASLKRNWIKEFRKWYVLTPSRGSYICERIDGRKREDLAAVTSLQITVVNYDIIGSHKAYLKSLNFDLVAIDEAQFLKNPDAARTKATLKICEGVERVVAMSGTPMLNRPIDLWPILSGLFSRFLPKRFRNKQNFGKHFCAGYLETVRQYDHKKCRTVVKKVWNFRGASNLDELNALLRERFMIRRVKKAVLPQLPDKRVSIIDLSAPAKIRRSIEIVNELSDQIIRSIETGARMPPLEGISSARKELAIEKVKPSVEFIETMLSHHEPVIVFCHHTEVADALQEALKEYGVSRITGSISQKARDKAVEDFQDGTNQVFIGNIQAAGTGLTLTASSKVIFVECSWVPGENAQAADRAHRIGQKSAVNIYYLCWFGSMDAQILKTSFRKQKNIDKVMK